jgi:hypothetical protein
MKGAGIFTAEPCRAIVPQIGSDITPLAPENPIQILEVRGDEPDRPVAITAAVTADASRAIFVALSEQLDRRLQWATETVEDVLVLREQQALVERFAPLASAGAHAIVRFTESELRACLLELANYAERVDGEHFQPVELRERLQTIAQIVPVLWDANANAAAVGGSEPLTRAAHDV